MTGAFFAIALTSLAATATLGKPVRGQFDYLQSRSSSYPYNMWERSADVGGVDLTTSWTRTNRPNSVNNHANVQHNSAKRAQASDDPVCIIGAGPAGLSSAHALESQGHQVVVFDKHPEVGGKCQAYYSSNDDFHPLGALLFTNETYVNTLQIISQTNVTAQLFGGPERVGWVYNWTSGAVSPSPYPPEAFRKLLATEIGTYVQWWKSKFAPSLTSPGYKGGVPEAFAVPASQWLDENNYRALPVLFNIGMVAYGYGDIRQTPILYMLQYFTPDILAFFAGAGPGYLIDFHKVFVQYAENVINGPIHTNTTVSRVDRSGPLPVLTYSTNGTAASETQRCSSVIMAFPPTLSALNTAGLDLSASELEVFAPVQITNYFAGAVQLSEVPRRQPYNVLSSSPALPPDAEAQPVAFISLHNTSNVATTWSWGALGSNYTLSHAYDLLKQVLSKINKDPKNSDATGVEVTDADVKAFTQTDYFPRFDEQKLAGGWYAKFDQLQGQQNTYWASGLNAFETVEFAVRAGLDIATTYFPQGSGSS